MHRQIFPLLLAGFLFIPQPTTAKAEEKDTFREVINKAKKKVFPALVFVKPIQEVYGGGKKEQMQVFGSGVIISPDGYCITNNHVAENAKSIKCVLSDKRQVEAEVIGLDKETDLGLLKLKVDPKDGPLPYATFGDSSKIEEGQFVMAMGSPFGFSRSVSFGIISYTRRYLEEGPYNLWIQTDAAINPGNSGGPLVNTAGEIIGINTLGTWADNIAFSIPSNTVKEVAELLKKNGKKGVMRTWTGITFQALKDYSKETIIESDKGVLIASVQENSPAGLAGIQSGDLILSCDKKPINGIYLEDLPAIRAFFAKLKISSTVEIAIERDKKILTKHMTLKPKGKVKGDDFECKRWSMTLKEINKFANPNVYFFRKKGVFVQGTDSPGNAALSGLSRGDILITIDGKDITSLADAKKIYEESLKKPDHKKKLLIQLIQQGHKEFRILDYRRDFKKMEEEE